MKIIFDLDDYYNEADCIDDLLDIKKEVPGLKVTLFTIPALSSQELLEKAKQYDWIQLAVHGYTHQNPVKNILGGYEFYNLSKEEAKELILKGYNEKYYVKGFKAPGWQISIATMEALRELGFWIAVQHADDRWFEPHKGQYQPAVIEGLRYYHLLPKLNDYLSIHGHTWEVCGNGIKKLKDYIVNNFKDSEFVFIDDYINKKYQTLLASEK